MQQVIETMSAIFFAMVLAVVGIGIGAGIVCSSHALNFKTETIGMLEECNYEYGMVNSCFEAAKEKGYVMTISMYYSDGRIVGYTEGNVRAGQTAGVTMAKVQIKYPFQIGILKLNEYLTTEGMAY